MRRSVAEGALAFSTTRPNRRASRNNVSSDLIGLASRVRDDESYQTRARSCGKLGGAPGNQGAVVRRRHSSAAGQPRTRL
jgi:hypothetical protein